MLRAFDFQHPFIVILDTRELLKGESEGLLQLPTDKALLDDPEFRPYVELYAKVTWAYFSQMPNTKLLPSFILYGLVFGIIQDDSMSLE